MTGAQLRTKTRTSISRKICYVESSKQGAHIHQPTIRLSRACRGRTAVLFPAKSSHMCCVELACAVKGLASAGKGVLNTGLPRSLT